MRGAEAALPPQFSLLKSEFNEFLFAPIGAEGNDTDITVLSALARLGVDPWQEAARLAQLSRELAKERLAAIISGLPNGRWMPSDVGAIAARLTDLLPAKRIAILPAGETSLRKRPASSTLMMLAVIAALGGSILVTMIARNYPPASSDGSFSRMTTSPREAAGGPSK